MEAASFGRYKITPVIRHGIPVVEENFWSDMEMAEQITNLVPAIRKKGYTTTAIICMSETEVTQARELLQDSLDLADGESNNYSAGNHDFARSFGKGSGI